MDTSFHQLLHVPRTTRKEVAETSFLLRNVRLTDPSVIRRMSPSLRHLRVIFRALGMHFVLNMNIEHFVLQQSFQISPSTVPDAKSRTATSPNITLTRKSDAPRYDRKRVKRPLQGTADLRMIRAWSQNEPVTPATSPRLHLVFWRRILMHFVLKQNMSCQGLHSKCKEIWASAAKSDTATSTKN